MKVTVSKLLKAIRKNCLACSGFSPKEVANCWADGKHGDLCSLHPYRMPFTKEHKVARMPRSKKRKK